VLTSKAEIKRQKAKRAVGFFKGYLSFCLFTFAFCLVVHAEDTVPTAASHFQAGLAYERLGRLDEAYTELQLACALDAEDARMALALGVVGLRLGRYDAAQRALERSITRDANSVASYYELALVYEKQKAVDRAIDSWGRFLDLNHDDSLKLEARKHLQFLESSSTPGASPKRRLTVILGNVKVLGADNQVTLQSNPLMAPTDALTPRVVGLEDVPRLITESAL
jgi:tetratricopeptide (TPR) repeat protein